MASSVTDYQLAHIKGAFLSNPWMSLAARRVHAVALGIDFSAKYRVYFSAFRCGIARTSDAESDEVGALYRHVNALRSHHQQQAVKDSYTSQVAAGVAPAVAVRAVAAQHLDLILPGVATGAAAGAFPAQLAAPAAPVVGPAAASAAAAAPAPAPVVDSSAAGASVASVAPVDLGRLADNM